MMIRKLWPCPHVEVRVHVSEEMIEDLRICREILEEERGSVDCRRCSWGDVEVIGDKLDFCTEDMLKAIEEKLGDDHGKINNKV